MAVQNVIIELRNNNQKFLKIIFQKFFVINLKLKLI